MKPIVYIETSFISFLTARPARDTIVAAHQKLTHRWWDERSERFELVVSELVRREASGGDPDAARARLSAIDRLAILPASDAAADLAERIVQEGLIPRESAADALHIAIAAVNGVDYLLTWNCKHLANAAHRNRIEDLVGEAGYECPVICTPEELMEE